LKTRKKGREKRVVLRVYNYVKPRKKVYELRIAPHPNYVNLTTGLEVEERKNADN